MRVVSWRRPCRVPCAHAEATDPEWRLHAERRLRAWRQRQHSSAMEVGKRRVVESGVAEDHHLVRCLLRVVVPAPCIGHATRAYQGRGPCATLGVTRAKR